MYIYIYSICYGLCDFQYILDSYMEKVSFIYGFIS